MSEVYVKKGVSKNEYKLYKLLQNLYSDFIPKLIHYDEKSEKLMMEKINHLSVSDMHTEDFNNVPPESIKKIRNIVKILYEDGFNYPDITGYNFIEDNNGKVWIIDFEHCFCKGSNKILSNLEKKQIQFIEDFVYNDICSWNPEFK
jgi:RIO-like serine/threonine protein kinase